MQGLCLDYPRINPLWYRDCILTYLTIVDIMSSASIAGIFGLSWVFQNSKVFDFDRLSFSWELGFLSGTTSRHLW